MRVPDGFLQFSFLRNLNAAKDRIAFIQERITTQSKVNKPSDSPLANSRIMRLKNQIRNNESYANNIEKTLFVENETDSKIRSSAQGLFMMMTNGFGAILGSVASGIVIDKFFTTNTGKDWHGIWLSFAVYSLIVAILFAILFKYKHNPEKIGEVKH